MIETKQNSRIPDGWEVIPLDQLLQLFGRIGFRGYNVTDLVQERKGAITLSPSNIENGIVTFDKCTYLSWEKYEESPEIKVEQGDILLVKTGSTYGKIGYVETLPWPSTINPQYVVLKKFKCNSRVLAYLLEQKEFQDQIESITSGGAIPTMSQAKILTCTVTLPKDGKEQQRIATALSDVDELIATLKKLIEKKRNIKKGAMYELLTGKVRILNYSDKWITKNLGEVGKPYKGDQINVRELKSDQIGYPVMNGGVSPSGYHDNYNTEGDTIIISEGGSCGFVSYMKCRFWAGGHCYVLRPQENIDIHYLYHVLKFNEPHIMALRTGSGLPNIKKTTLEAFEFNVSCSLKEQKAIGKILSDMDEEITNLEERLLKYQSLKQGMMQQLLTGKIRLI